MSFLVSYKCKYFIIYLQLAIFRVVVLLLSPTHIGHLMSAVKRLQHVGRSNIGDFIWMTFDSLEPFQMFPDQAASALVLKTRSGDIPAFENYFSGLDIRKNSRNPWFREYWEQVFLIVITFIYIFPIALFMTGCIFHKN